jgi:hypothetical protein
MSRLVALYSAAPGSGKSTTARVLESQGWAVEPFAAPLKRMAATLLLEAGYSEGHILEILTVNKDQPLTLLAGIPTARHLLQTLGTAWGREQISPMLWIQLWQRRVCRALANGTLVVVDDLRTEEEAAAVRAMGGQLWRIDRPGHQADPAALAHPTEGALEALTFDRVIINSGSLEQLEVQVLQEAAA